MIKLIKNGTIVTMNENKEIINADIVIKDDTIFDIVKDYSGKYDSMIDATGKIVMPGLINCHAHLGMSIFRGTNDGLDLMSWLNDKIWPIEEKMTSLDIYHANLLSLVEMIKTGTTCVADFYFEPFMGIEAIKKSKIRSVYSRSYLDLFGENKEKASKAIAEFEELLRLHKDKDPLITFALTPHSLYTCSEELLLKTKELADKYNLPIHIHFCEDENEVKQIKGKFGIDPVDVLEDLGFLENKLILAHGVFINDSKLNKLSSDNISIVNNIVSNLNLGCGVAPYEKYLNNGINICMGTDGQGSGLNMNLFNSMAYTSLVSKGINKNPLSLNSYKMLEMATINGAYALGLNNKIGSIEKFKKADLIILDLGNIEIAPINNLVNTLVHNVTPNNIKTTIVNGEVLMQDRRLLIDVDEKMLELKIKEIVKKLKIK